MKGSHEYHKVFRKKQGHDKSEKEAKEGEETVGVETRTAERSFKGKLILLDYVAWIN